MKSSSAESRFRAAFVRLAEDRPTAVPKGTALTQNNVAREAGVHPSALRASRYPALVAEIQAEASEQGRRANDQTGFRQHSRRSTTKLFEDMRRQRDRVASLLANADAEVLRLRSRVRELENEVAELMLPKADVLKLPSTRVRRKP